MSQGPHKLHNFKKLDKIFEESSEYRGLFMEIIDKYENIEAKVEAPFKKIK